MQEILSKVIYQIYPKSFKDTTNNGYGDINGIIQKIPYLKKLGIDMIWLSPIYTSPQVDNGYDVKDYYEIDSLYGSMEDFDNLVKIAKNNDIEIMLDMVFNHTSTEHIWFQNALKGEKFFQDFYFFSKEKVNWESKFGDSAFEYVESLGLYYLHLFDKTQADLNWENPNVIEEIINIIQFWLAKGVKGFRFDVINLISKPDKFIDSNFDGREMYTDGAKVCEYLQKIRSRTFKNDDIVTVGEMSSTTVQNCIKYSAPKYNTLNMTFNFHHLKLDYKDGEKWSLTPFNIEELKLLINKWQVEMDKSNGVNALFWSNHDQPRIVSRLGNIDTHHYYSASAVATLMFLLKGCSYIYQGEEIAMPNAYFDTIEQYNDVESLNFYHNSTFDEDTKIAILQAKSRDNGRTPMIWEEGFSNVKPWLGYSNKSYDKEIRDNTYEFFQKLIKVKKNPTFTYGKFTLIDSKTKLFIYKRVYKNYVGTVYVNLSRKIYDLNYDSDKIILNNYETINNGKILGFQTIVTLEML